MLNIGNTWAASLQATGAFMPFDDAALDADRRQGQVRRRPRSTTGGAPGQGPDLGAALRPGLRPLLQQEDVRRRRHHSRPTTWEELVADGQKLTNPARAPTAWRWRAAATPRTSTSPSSSASRTAASGSTPAGKPTFTSDGNVNGVKRYIDLMAADKVVNPSNAQYDNGTKAVNDFANGQGRDAAAARTTPTTRSSRNGMKPDEYGVGAVPGARPAGGKKVASFVAGINMSVFKNTKNKDAALKFVKFMTSDGRAGDPGQAVHGSLPVGQGRHDAGVHRRPRRGEDLRRRLRHHGRAAAAGARRETSSRPPSATPMNGPVRQTPPAASRSPTATIKAQADQAPQQQMR